MSVAIIATLIIATVTYVFIVSERVEPAAAAAIGGVCMVLFGLAPQHHALEAIDLNVVLLLSGMMIIVGILANTGVFEWIAVTIAKKARGNGLLILLGLLASTAVLSAVLDNVTTVVLIAPVTILLTQILGIRTIPFLILEAIFSNIGGSATLVGDPPNIIIGSHAALSFNAFLSHLAPAIVLIAASGMLFLTIRFWGRLEPTAEACGYIQQARPERAITQRAHLQKAGILVPLIFIGFVLGPLMGVEPGPIALAGAMILVILTRTSLEHAFKMIDWNTVFLLIGLFMLVSALEYNGLFRILGNYLVQWTAGDLLATTLAILWLSGVLSGFLGNIPVVMSMIPLTQTILDGFNEAPPAHDTTVLWWALALGCCLGGNGTMMGAAANLVVVQIARRNNYHLSFWTFARYGLPSMLACLLLSSLYLYLRYFVWGGV